MPSRREIQYLSWTDRLEKNTPHQNIIMSCFEIFEKLIVLWAWSGLQKGWRRKNPKKQNGRIRSPPTLDMDINLFTTELKENENKAR
ncbi:hypothetical protein EVAR_8878_1 [Eumeta japonica]|uniref:Uncharacterized protein n=1 Tax=Eumeta variegata TaxID=151549 RepID=A0A4C1U0J7_EUMVA|nr:hypothetical protein EVAR_8878_1 [Eumeta japonica]